jgi:hypothetical protein
MDRSVLQRPRQRESKRQPDETEAQVLLGAAPLFASASSMLSVLQCGRFAVMPYMADV